MPLFPAHVRFLWSSSRERKSWPESWSLMGFMSLSSLKMMTSKASGTDWSSTLRKSPVASSDPRLHWWPGFSRTAAVVSLNQTSTYQPESHVSCLCCLSAALFPTTTGTSLSKERCIFPLPLRFNSAKCSAHFIFIHFCVLLSGAGQIWWHLRQREDSGVAGHGPGLSGRQRHDAREEAWTRHLHVQLVCAGLNTAWPLFHEHIRPWTYPVPLQDHIYWREVPDLEVWCRFHRQCKLKRVSLK